jgi:hypothetical protein
MFVVREFLSIILLQQFKLHKSTSFQTITKLTRIGLLWASSSLPAEVELGNRINPPSHKKAAAQGEENECLGERIRV